MSDRQANHHRNRQPANRLRRRPRVEQLESRNLLAALPLGATSEDTGEFLLGRVAVVPVLFNSNGVVDAKTQNWTPAEIDFAIETVRTGVQWWADALDQLNTVHELEFVIDSSFATNPFSTDYEPIDRTSQEAPLYISPFLRAQGIGNAPTLEDGVRQFNNAARERLNTDWAFTVFIVDSSDDPDRSFAAGTDFRTAFAFAGGLYIVSPSTRPASTIAHETGHIFWARDEYPGGGSYNDRRGYYDAQNTNAIKDAPAGFVQAASIMSSGGNLTASFNSHTLPASTRALIGWQDSDGDGIFDLADVPLHFKGDGSYNSQAGVFTFDGNARAVALPNKNSSGPQNDITLNRVDRIEYRVDQGPWLTATVVDAQVANVQFELTIGAFTTIELRAIDDSVGVTSSILRTTGTAPIVSGASIAGYAFLDANGEGEQDPAESALSQVTATLSKQDGSPLFAGIIEPDSLPSGMLLTVGQSVELSAQGASLDDRIGIFTGIASTGTKSFRYLDRERGLWREDWTADNRLVAQFAETVGLAELDAIGIGSSGSYARLEAYDASGTVLTRFTTPKLAVGQTLTMRVEDALGRIASIRASGHQSSGIGLDALRFGTDPSVVTGADGAFRFQGLPDGTYKLNLTAERLIYSYLASGATITVSSGLAAPVAAGFLRVASPWRNLVDRFDVDANGRVQALDALKIINEIARRGPRILQTSDQNTAFFDTSDDGSISALDALRVINEIARRNRSGGQGEAEAFDSVFAAWEPDPRAKQSQGKS